MSDIELETTTPKKSKGTALAVVGSKPAKKSAAKKAATKKKATTEKKEVSWSAAKRNKWLLAPGNYKIIRGVADTINKQVKQLGLPYGHVFVVPLMDEDQIMVTFLCDNVKVLGTIPVPNASLIPDILNSVEKCCFNAVSFKTNREEIKKIVKAGPNLIKMRITHNVVLEQIVFANIDPKDMKLSDVQLMKKYPHLYDTTKIAIPTKVDDWSIDPDHDETHIFKHD